LIAVALLAACSDEPAPPPAAEAPPAAAAPAPAATSAAAPQQQQAPADKADIAAAEVTEPDPNAADPCDLSGYDMSKMTVSQHEDLVKACERSKQ
jgi:hypothetical protein